MGKVKVSKASVSKGGKRAKPMMAKSGYTGNARRYGCGGKIKK